VQPDQVPLKELFGYEFFAEERFDIDVEPGTEDHQFLPMRHPLAPQPEADRTLGLFQQIGQLLNGQLIPLPIMREDLAKALAFGLADVGLSCGVGIGRGCSHGWPGLRESRNWRPAPAGQRARQSRSIARSCTRTELSSSDLVGHAIISVCLVGQIRH
jgi:hypothetical protein